VVPSVRLAFAMNPPTRVMVRLHAVLEYRPVAVDLVSTLIAHVSSADRAFRNEMVTAFGEAFNNIVMHGYRDRDDGMLDIEATITHDEMTLRLSDRGRSVDFESVPSPDLESVPEGGMGIFIIHAMVDEVGYQAGPPNVLTLTKRISSPPPSPLAERAPEPEPEPENR
jgi:serine/threonine-protein kinase RsbW